MSLVRRDPDPARAVLERLRSTNPDIVIERFEYYHTETHGHLYNNPHISSSNSTLNIGDVGRMSHPGHRASRASLPQEGGHDYTPPPSDNQDTIDVQSRLSLTEPPPDYHAREADWFRPGRFFKIWARDGDNVNVEIHCKEFVLLDTKNIDGPGLLVRRHATEHCDAHRGSFNRTHVVLKNFQSSSASGSVLSSGAPSRRKVVYMDEDDDEVSDHTYIELEHTYNIPFVKYKCIDYGVLAVSSLQDLRRFYVEWLQYHWQLG